MSKNEKRCEDPILKIIISDEKDKQTLGTLLAIIFQHTTYSGKEGVEILNLIAKCGNYSVIECLIKSLEDKKVQLHGMFCDAIKNNCVDLVHAIIDIDKNILKEVNFEYSLEVAKLSGYTEIVDLFEKIEY